MYSRELTKKKVAKTKKELTFSEWKIELKNELIELSNEWYSVDTGSNDLYVNYINYDDAEILAFVIHNELT